MSEEVMDIGVAIRACYLLFLRRKLRFLRILGMEDIALWYLFSTLYERRLVVTGEDTRTLVRVVPESVALAVELLGYYARKETIS